MMDTDRRPTVQSRALLSQERQYYAHLIEALKAARKARGLSQADLDHRLGVSEGMVAKWEIAARLPGAFFLMLWSRELGMRLTVEREAA